MPTLKDSYKTEILIRGSIDVIRAAVGVVDSVAGTVGAYARQEDREQYPKILGYLHGDVGGGAIWLGSGNECLGWELLIPRGLGRFQLDHYVVASTLVAPGEMR